MFLLLHNVRCAPLDHYWKAGYQTNIGKIWVIKQIKSKNNVGRHQISWAVQYVFHKCHICHSELETDSDAAAIGLTGMDTNEYRCLVSTNKEAELVPDAQFKMDVGVFFKCYSTWSIEKISKFPIHGHTPWLWTVRNIVRWHNSQHTCWKSSVFIFFPVKFSKWPETERSCEWVKHKDLLKDLLESSRSNRYGLSGIYIKSCFTYYEFNSLFCMHLQNLNLYLNLKNRKLNKMFVVSIVY